MLHLRISQSDGLPLYQQLVRQIKRLIATGRLEAEDELPAVRVLAQQLVVNPNTVVRAYRELEVAGLIYKRRGSGTYVKARGTPYTDVECRRMLSERAEALLVEARNLGYTLKQVLEVVRESSQRLDAVRQGEGS